MAADYPKNILFRNPLESNETNIYTQFGWHYWMYVLHTMELAFPYSDTRRTSVHFEEPYLFFPSDRL